MLFVHFLFWACALFFYIVGTGRLYSLHAKCSAGKNLITYFYPDYFSSQKYCSTDHQLRLLANYEAKKWRAIKCNVTWGAFTITVGKESDYNK